MDRIVLSWLHLHYGRSALRPDLKTIFAYAERVSPAAAVNGAARYLSAIRTLAQVRRLQVPAVQVNIAREQLNVAAIVARRAGPRGR